MKKLLNKVARRKKQPELSSRITNDTVAEHREQVLAGGRRFKYPVQYSKHKLVINSVLIILGALLLILLVGWWQLYSVQNYSRFMYRVTQIIPAPVASVDGSPVRYSDYLQRLTSSIYYLQLQNQINIKSADGKRQVEFTKRKELDSAIFDQYVRKVAADKKIKVSDKEVDDFIQREILDSKAISKRSYEQTVLRKIFNWSLDEYKTFVRAQLLKRKVAFALDASAKTKIEAIQAQLASGADFATVAKEKSEDPITKPNGGEVASLPISTQDTSGLVAAARKLEPNQLSPIIEGADGYYIIKLKSKTADAVQYAQIKINLTALNDNFEKVKKDGKIKEYIKVNKQG
jgi:parvulin-like peptidyl-prolyl isomerase